MNKTCVFKQLVTFYGADITELGKWYINNSKIHQAHLGQSTKNSYNWIGNQIMTNEDNKYNQTDEDL